MNDTPWERGSDDRYRRNFNGCRLEVYQSHSPGRWNILADGSSYGFRSSALAAMGFAEKVARTAPWRV